MEKKDIAIVGVKAPAQLIELAIEKGNIDLEKLEKLMRLQREHEADNAKKAFNSNMVLTQQDIPCVAKTLKNDQTHSKYASLDEIITQTKKIYTQHGFSISFYEGETPMVGCIRICADVVHAQGHKETYHYDVPMDGVGIKGNANMTAIHAKASSTSYAQRYLMCMIWNIPTADNDAQDIGQVIEYITDKERSELTDLAVDCQANMPKLMAYLKVEDLSKLPKSEFQKAKLALIAKKVKATR